MIIGIDIDDTICETTLSDLKYLAKYNERVLEHHNLSFLEYEKFLYKYIDDIFNDCSLKEGVKEAFRYLNENGYKIFIITARNNKYSENVTDITKKYLETNGLKYDKILFDKSEKGFDAFNNGVQIFIDDKEIILDNISKYGIECIRITKDKDSKYKTFSNWFDIINYLKSREG